MTHAYTYTEQNRLKALVLTNAQGSLLRGFAYGLSPAGHRTDVRETETDPLTANIVQRRQAVYEYDRDYLGGTTPHHLNRLTRETIFDPMTNAIGTITHVYDKVGNRTQREASLSFTPAEPVDYQNLTFGSRDQIDNDSDPANGNGYYDANGNTLTNELGVATGDLYDAENHLIRRGSTIQIAYDHEGNRAWKTVNGTNTFYLLDDRNPSGYIQVLAEFSTTNIPPDRAYAYGHELISEGRNTGTPSSPGWTISYYGFDGHGSVRLLTDSTTAATVTDTYDYDAYGSLLANTGDTPNNYRYTGQQWDADLGMYHLRARYYKPDIGRFWTMDSYEGDGEAPLSLHKYLFCRDNPVNLKDLSGHDPNLGTQLIGMFGRALLAGARVYMAHPVQNTATIVAFTSGLIGYDLYYRFTGNSPTMEQAAHIDQALFLISHFGNGRWDKQVAKGRHQTFTISKDLYDYGWTPLVRFDQVLLWTETFKLDDPLLASVLLHELTHACQWVAIGDKTHEMPAYQAQSDFLRPVGVHGTLDELQSDPKWDTPDDHDFFVELSKRFKEYPVDNPAIRP